MIVENSVLSFTVFNRQKTHEMCGKLEHISQDKKNTWAFKKTMLSDEKFKITIYCLGTMNWALPESKSSDAHLTMMTMVIVSLWQHATL